MKSIKKLETWLSKNKLAVPGTIRTVYSRCGKAGCKCKSGNEEDKHGPYNIWDRKVAGKMTSSSVPTEELKNLEKWIQNRNNLEEILIELKEESEAFAKKAISSK